MSEMQVILNLAVNARDAMPLGGKLTIQTVEVSLDAQHARSADGASHVELRVSDTGVGMDKISQGRVFEPFLTTKAHGKGAGLGLSTVFGIVSQSGGVLEVDSEPGRGTSFHVFFPIADVGVAARSSSIPPAPRALGGSETILVVEDDERVRALTRTILNRYGYQVLDAATGTAALRLCEQHRGTSCSPTWSCRT